MLPSDLFHRRPPFPPSRALAHNTDVLLKSMRSLYFSYLLPQKIYQRSFIMVQNQFCYNFRPDMGFKFIIVKINCPTIMTMWNVGTVIVWKPSEFYWGLLVKYPFFISNFTLTIWIKVWVRLKGIWKYLIQPDLNQK